MRLRSLDPIDAEPTAAWKGTAVHAILEQWHNQGEQPGALLEIARAELAKMSAHPLMRSLWQPRLLKALEWIDTEIVRQAGEGRKVLVSEAKGDVTFHGVKIHGRADRIDQLPDGSLAVVDYKTGGPPSSLMVEKGFALQLGLIGLMAREGAFKGVNGEAQRFEYWSLAKKDDNFGYIKEPVRDPGSRARTGPMRDEFLAETERYLIDAIDKWIKGSEPFVARLNPDLGGYNDYDQLMRLDEWQGREDKA